MYFSFDLHSTPRTMLFGPLLSYHRGRDFAFHAKCTAICARFISTRDIASNLIYVRKRYSMESCFSKWVMTDFPVMANLMGNSSAYIQVLVGL
jgi:hypothetical protein